MGSYNLQKFNTKFNVKDKNTITNFLMQKVEELVGIKKDKEEFVKTKISDIGLDSLSIFELVMMIEEEFKVEVDDQFLIEEPTFEKIINLIYSNENS